ncbi:MAG: leucine-rich repeat domain-containing protein [Candidatus Poribacteria bacterium]|nr:leucine-rich repeat domain-containing protein [Candidatus Poribacteria bacterium]
MNTHERYGKVKDLSGLEHAANVTALFLVENEIRDLSPLAGLTQLRLLMLHGNPLRDLALVANLTQLTYLGIIGCPVSDLRPLANLTRLEELDAHDCEITDIAPLANLTRLTHLQLANNRIADISPLANLTALEKLWLENNRITDITPLASLTNLRELRIFHNRHIVDYSPISALSLDFLRRDEECLVPSLPIHDRINDRSFPSICTLWGSEVITKEPMSYLDRQALHDLHANPVFLHIGFRDTPGGFQMAGDIENAMHHVEERRARNPNTIFLNHVRQRDAFVGGIYPEDWEYWLRDENGNRVRNRGHDNCYLIDFRIPEVQDIIVEKVIAVSKCGLYDGIFFDWWQESGGTLVDYDPGSGPNISYSNPAEEREARLNILRRIRANVPDDFLIIGNANRRQLPHFAPYQNGNFMELRYDRGVIGYTRDGIVEIETNLIWLEHNMREPQINCLQAIGIHNEPGDSPRNMQYMRLFTTMSLTCSDGYVVYTLGGAYTDRWSDIDHLWYDFWDADLGQPVGEIATPYQGIEGLYIREFTNGWAVYNRSGSAHVIELPENAQSVRSGLENTSHAVPDLDGNIFLKATVVNPVDVNGDGAINILDLVLVANSLGTGENDVNGDGVTNVFDLVIIANAINQ